MTNLPLHKEAQSARLDRAGNGGLWFDKFFNGYKDKDFAKPDAKDKASFANALIYGTRGIDSELKRYEGQANKLVTARGGCSGKYSIAWRLATGLGGPHAMENHYCPVKTPIDSIAWKVIARL